MRGKPLVVNLPFPGFYESILSQELDHIEEMESEHFEVDWQQEERIPYELRLDGQEISSLIFDCMRYGIAHDYLAKQYVAAFREVAKEVIEFDFDLEYESMTSPREYNFETDRVFAYIPRAVVRWLYVVSKKEGHATLAKVIRERFTSRSGFSSWYANDLATWLQKPVLQWDHNELGTLLIAVLHSKDPSLFEGRHDLEWKIFDCMADYDSDFYEAFNRALDYDKFIGLMEEAREEKRAELDPDWVAPTPRCTRTMDMFTGKEG